MLAALWEYTAESELHTFQPATITKYQGTMLSSLNKFIYNAEERTTPIFRVRPRMQYSLFLRNAGHVQHHALEGLFRNASCVDCLKITDRPKSEIYLSCLNCAVSFIPTEIWKTDEKMLIWLQCFRILVNVSNRIIEVLPLDCISVLLLCTRE